MDGAYSGLRFRMYRAGVLGIYGLWASGSGLELEALWGSWVFAAAFRVTRKGLRRCAFQPSVCLLVVRMIPERVSQRKTEGHDPSKLLISRKKQDLVHQHCFMLAHLSMHRCISVHLQIFLHVYIYMLKLDRIT